MCTAIFLLYLFFKKKKKYNVYKKKKKYIVYNWGQRNGFDKGENVTDEEGLDSNCYGTTAASTY